MVSCNPSISIHAPRGGSDYRCRCHFPSEQDFNPRSPWGERRLLALCVFVAERFQSTLPVGGATFTIITVPTFSGISIHAPRGGSDDSPTKENGHTLYFNPRSPWGERRWMLPTGRYTTTFQSTLPVGGATRARNMMCGLRIFQSTLPVGGATTRSRKTWTPR